MDRIMTYNVSKNLTLDVELSKTKDYKTCLDAIEYLRLSGIVEHAAGNCIAMSDLIQHTLQEFGISSRIVECKLVVARRDNGKLVEFRYLGFNGTSVNSEFIDTHAVVVTETEIPMLIDLSISHMFTSGKTWLVERIKENDEKVISRIDIPDGVLTYSHKKSIRLLGLHQNNILDRIEIDRQTKKTLTFMHKILIVLGVLSVFNFTMNSLMLHSRYTVTIPIMQEIKNEVINKENTQ